VRRALHIAALLLAGCGKSEAGLGPAASDTLELPDIAMSAKRPTLHFYMERTSDRCSVYGLDGVVKSPAKDEACPEDLLLGERIRIAGMTCTREGETPDRSLPVVCPGSLLRFEKASRLAAASASASAAPVAVPSASSPQHGGR
jgi:hypothetical protein